jgi:hypothetical protein
LLKVVLNTITLTLTLHNHDHYAKLKKAFVHLLYFIHVFCQCTQYAILLYSYIIGPIVAAIVRYSDLHLPM